MADQKPAMGDQAGQRLVASDADRAADGMAGGSGGWWVACLRAIENRTLRWLALAFVGFNAAEYGEWIAILVYAYAHGGATTSGIVAVVQLVPCAVLAPVLARFGDRYEPERVLRAAYLAQAALLLVVAAAVAGRAPPLVVYAAATLAAIPFTVPRPIQAVLLPAVSRSAGELTAANVVSGWMEGTGIVLGPLGAALLIGPAGIAGVLAAFAIVTLGSFVAAGRSHTGARAAGSANDAGGGSSVGSITDTLRAVWAHPAVLVLLTAGCAQFVVIGSLDVLNLVLALNLLHTGRGGVGVLNAAFGLGGMVSIVFTTRLVGRSRLAPVMIVAALAWGIGFFVLAVQHTMLAAVMLLASASIASSVLNVCGQSLLQRVAPPELLAGIFGLLEGMAMAAFAVGSLLVPILVVVLGDRGAVAGVGMILPICVIALLPWLWHIDRHATIPIVEITLLRRVAMFAALPPPQLESLARALRPLHAPQGSELVHQGEDGDRLFVIADGTVAITRNQQPLAELQRGDIFGEIALLNDAPRTATATATTATSLYALDKEPFIAALTNHAPAHQTAQALAERRTARHEP